MCVSFPVTGLHDLVHQNPTVKGLSGRKGPVMHFNLDPVQGLKRRKYKVGTETLSGLWFDPDNTSGPVMDTRSCLL